VAGGSEKVTIAGQTRHVLSYLKDFLFTPDRARQPVRALSGGERNRLLLARLFTQPANLLVMDEPTNDLDTETLELLEELLLNFEGTLLLVSHDRALLDAVVTSTLVFEGDGRVSEYVGGYEDWLHQRPLPRAQAEPTRMPKSGKSPKLAGTGTDEAANSLMADKAPDMVLPRRDKLSFKELRELEALPARIEALEMELQSLQTRMGEVTFYQQPGTSIAQTRERMAGLEAELGMAYTRWESLETRKA
jgi:ATP-binding cassette subfamily F protein uup